MKRMRKIILESNTQHQSIFRHSMLVIRGNRSYSPSMGQQLFPRRLPRLISVNGSFHEPFITMTPVINRHNDLFFRLEGPRKCQGCVTSSSLSYITETKCNQVPASIICCCLSATLGRPDTTNANGSIDEGICPGLAARLATFVI